MWSILLYTTENFPQSHDNFTWLADTATSNTSLPSNCFGVTSIGVGGTEVRGWSCLWWRFLSCRMGFSFLLRPSKFLLGGNCLIQWSCAGGFIWTDHPVYVSELLNVAVSASHVKLSCDCGKFSVVYSSIDHINITQLSSPTMSCNKNSICPSFLLLVNDCGSIWQS